MAVAGEWADPYVDSAFGGVELLHARFRTHAFDRHAHDEFVIAVVIEGAERFRCRGVSHVAPTGWIYTINPGEAHDGAAATDQGWHYHALYPSRRLMRLALGDHRVPEFRDLVWRQPAMAERLVALHSFLRAGGCALDKESALLATLQMLADRNGRSAPVTHTGGGRGLRRVHALMSEAFAEKHSLRSLGAEAELHPNYLIAAFKRRYGLTPSQFLRMRRLAHAKDLIRAGEPLKNVAQDSGFYDQPHFARAFKRSFGVTPAVYADGIAR